MRFKNAWPHTFAVALVAAVLLAAPGAWAQKLWEDKNGGTGGNGDPSTLPSFVKLVREVGPAVVHIGVTKTFRHPAGKKKEEDAPEDPFEQFRRFFGPMTPPRMPQRQQGLGTGFVIHTDGYIVTNNHVVENADKIEVKFYGNDTEYPAKIIGRDPKTDIALIKIDQKPKGMVVAKLGDSDKLEVGEWVLAIGNPLGLEQTVTKGIISAKGRRDVHPDGAQGYFDFIQTDAAINQGNSGGPLLDMSGAVVGINSAIINPQIASGIGFAIPINMAKQILPQLKEKGQVERSWIGVTIQPVTRELADSFGIPEARGALVAEIAENGPAAKAGVKAGDIILEFEGKRIVRSDDLPWLASTAGVGKKVSLKILRDRKNLEIEVKLGRLPDSLELAQAQEEPGTEGGAKEAAGLGLKVMPVPPQIRKGMGLKKDDGGVLVTEVDRDVDAGEAGVRKGDVILSVNDTRLNAPADFQKATASLKNGEIVRLRLKRDRGSIFVAFRKG